MKMKMKKRLVGGLISVFAIGGTCTSQVPWEVLVGMGDFDPFGAKAQLRFADADPPPPGPPDPDDPQYPPPVPPPPPPS